jgi:hypothetical protein
MYDKTRQRSKVTRRLPESTKLEPPTSPTATESDLRSGPSTKSHHPHPPAQPGTFQRDNRDEVTEISLTIDQLDDPIDLSVCILTDDERYDRLHFSEREAATALVDHPRNEERHGYVGRTRHGCL